MDELAPVLRLQQGDLSALDELYHLHAETALRTAYIITRSQVSAEDAVQDAFVEVIHHAHNLRDPQAFRAWFYRIVVNKAKRASRRSVLRWLPVDLLHHDKADPSAIPPDEAVTHAAELAEVSRALDELPAPHRLPLTLRYFTGLSEAEIAAALNIPAGTVKSRLHHGRKQLQATLARRERRGYVLHLEGVTTHD